MTPQIHRALISVHDVMPSTLERVAALVALAAEHELHHVTLLVVPGLDWHREQIDQLRRWQDAGHDLAAHGWTHRCRPPRSWGHRLHSWLLSRDVAEHLSATPAERIEILSRSADWFERHHLGLPTLYVPPAWALAMPTRELRTSPFALIETLPGLVFCATGRRLCLPLVGFEADTSAREFCVSRLNRWNQTASQLTGRPVRVGLHPFDLDLRLQAEARRTLRSCQAAMRYDQLLRPTAVLTSSA